MTYCVLFIIYINRFICFPSLSFSFKFCVQLCDDVCGVQVVNYSMDCAFNCIDDYRAAIGLFHIRIKGNRRPFKFKFPVYTYQEILLTNFRCTFLVVSLSLLQNLNPNIDIVFLLFVL